MAFLPEAGASDAVTAWDVDRQAPQSTAVAVDGSSRTLLFGKEWPFLIRHKDFSLEEHV